MDSFILALRSQISQSPLVHLTKFIQSPIPHAFLSPDMFLVWPFFNRAFLHFAYSLVTLTGERVRGKRRRILHPDSPILQHSFFNNIHSFLTFFVDSLSNFCIMMQMIKMIKISNYTMIVPLILLLFVDRSEGNQCPGASSSALRPKYCKKTCAIDDDCRRHKKHTMRTRSVVVAAMSILIL
ncbi:hypothetical protein PRIPAC_70621 [Pristionchus pacificus]|uniref:Uncharacterized protein n=1 Tax=Pristionchus pacificus TaxID=54126 RepID=A0A2A6CFD6_PRIPA|nr:hypothetical protein PRIPAC_70621 [Pristionchus pacificus]|eukprot:PDM76798.1 hypothetical protein PRIPAC_42193 [Pristionchus pacificus]